VKRNKGKTKVHNKSGSEHHDKPSGEKPVSGDVKIHGAVQVFEVQSSIEKHDAERKDDKTYKDATNAFEKSYLTATRITMFVTALYFVATCLIFLQGKRSADIADKTLTASQRPWVGIARDSFKINGVIYLQT
jgi:hypothetical protein